MATKLTDKEFVHTMSDTHSIFGNFGGKVAQMPIGEFRRHLNDNDEEVLNNLAFYIDVNKASTLGSTRVDVGGDMNMRQLWEDAGVDVLMDSGGNCCALNRHDARYTAEGDYLLDGDGKIASAYAHCDFMHIIPRTYGRVQTVTVGATSFQRLWLSLVPLPGGYVIPQQVVAKFKACVAGGQMRSLPGVAVTVNRRIDTYWDNAQARSKNHGLANLDFRNHLLFHMMSKYAWRDSQNCKTADGTPVWGVGLDGTEGLASGETYQGNGQANQQGVVTGATLSLGTDDGNVPVTLANGNTAHSVSVAGFENPWGQYREMVQGLCSVGTDVYCWRHNWLPTGTPSAETFAGVEHVLLTRATGSAWAMNIIASHEGQGVYMVPRQTTGGVSYGDSHTYGADGQLWLFGGNSASGANCGLADAYSSYAWSRAATNFSARLAYYGGVNMVSARRLAELGA